MTDRLWRTIGIGLVCAAFGGAAGCGDAASGGGTNSEIQQDAGGWELPVLFDTMRDSNASDPGGDVPPCEGCFGAPCDENDDCDSGLCIEGPYGLQCTKECDEDCPAGYACKALGTGTDVTYVCIYAHLPYCAPCREDGDCGHPLIPTAQTACLAREDGSGSFCATECVDELCPTGAECTGVEIGDEILALCLPSDGAECQCTRYATDNAASTDCFNTGEAGTCAGVRVCGDDGLTACDALIPAAETCNAVDDNCDGVTDETFPEDGQVCDGEDSDDCTDGVWTCPEGALVCDDDPEGVAETCNGADDDCDGATDALDSDMVIDPCDKQDGVCAGVMRSTLLCTDGSWDPCPDLLYSSASADYQPGVEVSCDGLDNDCDGDADEDFVLLAPDGTEIYGVGQPCGVGACFGGTTLCNELGTGIACSTDGQMKPEVCDSADNDCDDLIDAADPDFVTPLCELQSGVCEGSTKPGELCVDSNWTPCTADHYTAFSADYQASEEVSCDGLDNDCDGAVDEDFEYVEWDGSVLGVGDPCGTGECAGGVVACGDDDTLVCSTTDEVATELCDGVDQDCDGVVDNGCDDDGDGYCDANYAVLGSPAVCPAGDDDCDDEDADVNPGADETCNQVDDNCDGVLDTDAVDCATEACTGSGNAYVHVPQSVCDQGICTIVNGDTCGNYTCVGGGANGDTCAVDCVDDSTCIDSAFCDLNSNTCEPQYGNGDGCTDDSQCTSGHCQNGFCCAAGDCCVLAADCPAAYFEAPACIDPQGCQGTRRDALCVSSMCSTTDPLPDDSACGVDQMAIDCSPFDPVFCTGGTDQTVPSCPGDCVDDSECIDGFHCDGTCEPDVEDGGACDENSDCVGDHCQNGFCCTAGDCCSLASDCPAAYVTEPICDVPAVCQGHRADPTCVSNMCGTTPDIDDDSGCTSTVEASDCGFYVSVFCTGGSSQFPLPCPNSCVDDIECDANAHCDGTCQEDLPDGSGCDEDSDCVSDHCQNGFCCDAGDCCVVAGDCPASYTSGSACNDTVTCQGTSTTASCNGFICGSVPGTPDDTGCAVTTLAKNCGYFPDLYCDGTGDQSEPLCATSCSDDSQCDTNAWCDGSVCQPDLPNGDPCGRDQQCVSVHCQNAFCCTSGDCCSQPADCPASYTAAPSCDDAATCQGSRQDATCQTSMCGTTAVIADDSTCDGSVLALDCTPYNPIFCTGAVNQTAPSCPETCINDTDCVGGYHCDGTCQPDLGDGEACDENSDCISGHCQNGFCCASGDCCGVAVDCPAGYTTSPICDDVPTCQGHRNDPTCVASICGSSFNIDDDSACTSSAEANTCGYYDSVFCAGTPSQVPPVCPTSCTVDADCDANAHCDGTCQADLPDGDGCDENSDCISGHCQNGFCCAAGDCCVVAGDCPASYSSASACNDTVACQGTSTTASCSSFICGSLPGTADDSGCSSGTLSKTCGLYPSVYCNGAVSQTEPPCATSCSSDSDCDANAWCNGSTCQADLGDGSGCGRAAQCISGYCANGFCCASGDCCSVAGDCPAGYANSPICDSTATCQGHRNDRTCTSSICGTSLDINDDSDCAVTDLANTCGYYVSIYCTGAQAQTPPSCPTSCTVDAECDANAHCDGTCQADLGDGSVCDENSDCISGHCQNGFCCASGDCCAVAGDCPGSYSSPSVCDFATTCQGTREDATCTSSICGTQSGVADDSACTSGTLSSDCGPYPSAYCNGAASQSQPSCPTTCADNSDCDPIPSACCVTGTCEYPTGPDLPDDNFIDLNCDGIDGDESIGMFVATNGNNSNPGTRAAPKQTIQAGINAATDGMHVYISAGTYNESLSLKSGVSLYGGYSRANNWARSEAYVVTINSPTNIGVDCWMDNNLVLDHLTIIASNNTSTGGSSWALWIDSSSNVTVRRCKLYGDDGGNGGNGNGGAVGGAGSTGSNGNAGCEDSSFVCGGCSAPVRGAGGGGCGGNNGGLGGSAGHNNGSGGWGASGVGPGGAGGGPSTCDRSGCGSCGTVGACYNGKNGTAGGVGTAGANGAGGASFNTGAAGQYAPAHGTDGSLGTNGGGGGGGGGGRGGNVNCDSYGSSGGGGGGGGCRGGIGTRGTGGGGSFGAWVYNSASVVITYCDIYTGSGGDGGGGGSGGNGGAGGSGGSGWVYGGCGEQDDGGCGGNGATGGTGGRGGHGGGGGGGPSVGIVFSDCISATQNNNTFNIGPGGSGGNSAGNNGSTGWTGNTRSI